jgi:hypothetical protein
MAMTRTIGFPADGTRRLARNFIAAAEARTWK